MTDTNKWDDPWFTELSGEYKLLWIYLLDKCDHAGFWKVNKPLTEFYLKHKYNWDDVLSVFKHRIVSINQEVWHIPKFVEFQYKELNPNNRAHLSVLDRLSKYEVDKNKGLTSPYLGAKDKDKDKVKEKEGKALGFKKPGLEELTEAITTGGLEAALAKAEAHKFLNYYESVGWVVGRTRKPMKSWRGAVSTWIDNCREWRASAATEKHNPNKKLRGLPSA